MPARRVKRLYPMQIAMMRLLDQAWFGRGRQAAALRVAARRHLAKKQPSRY